jgi:hypothetical protein
VSLFNIHGLTSGRVKGETNVQNFEYYIMQLEKELRVPQQASPRLNPSHA